VSSPEALPVLAAALEDEEPLIGGHAAWAQGRIPMERSTAALLGRLELERDGWAREEIELALQEVAGSERSTSTPSGDPVRPR
jgi:epoxyqueuosine reductase